MPSGLVAVVVPSGCRVRFQPHRWMAVRWWKPQRGTRLGRLVGPPRDLGVMWWMSQTVDGWSQPGKAQCGWRVVAARRRWAGMVSVAAPMSRGRLVVVSGVPSRAARSRAASPSGPERVSAARPSRARRSRSRVAGLSEPPGPARAAGACAGPARSPVRRWLRRAGLTGPGPAAGQGRRAAGRRAAGSTGAVRAGGVAGVAADAVGEQEGLGELVQGGPVHVPGHHRHHRRIAQRGVCFRAGQPARLGGPRGRPGILGRRGARGAPQLGQGQVHQHLGRLPGPGRDHPGADQPPAGFLQRVMTALRRRSGCPPGRPSSPAPPAPPPERPRTQGSGPLRRGRRRGR